MDDKGPLLAPLGSAEPDDVQGWMENGGCLALQLALSMTPVRLRDAWSGLSRRDGTGELHLLPGQDACVNLALAPVPSPARLLLEELPLWMIEGALLLARACEQDFVTIHLPNARYAERALLDDVLEQVEALGITGARGWGGGIRVVLRNDSPKEEALDPVTTRLLPLALWTGKDPGTTLLGITGAVEHAAVYEVPLGLPLEHSLDTLRSRAGPPTAFLLGGQLLSGADLAAPLTYERFGRDLGSGRLTLVPVGHPASRNTR